MTRKILTGLVVLGAIGAAFYAAQARADRLFKDTGGSIYRTPNSHTGAKEGRDRKRVAVKEEEVERSPAPVER